MGEVIVTRGGQITLTKDVREKLDIREGDTIVVNTMGDIIIAGKRDTEVFEKHDFLPENFQKTLKKIKSSPEERLKRFGIVS